MSNALFTSIMSNAGIPTDQAQLTVAWRQLAVDEKVMFNNDSHYSPFWRLVTAIVTKPVLWLLGLLTNDILPNLFLKTATGKWIDLYGWSVGVERKPASKAMGMLRLYRYSNTMGGQLHINAGTVIQTNPINGSVYRVIVREEAVFAEGTQAVDVLVDAEKTGESYNIGTGYSIVVDTNLAGLIERIVSDNWLLVPGADEELDHDYRLRCRNQFMAVNGWHIDASYKAMISQFQGIDIEDIYLEHNAPRGPGTANAFILFDADVPSAEYLTKINYFIHEAGNHGFGDDLQVFAMTTYPINIELSVWLIENMTADQQNTVILAINHFIRTAFRELNNVDYSPTRTLPNKRFSWSRLIKELHFQFDEIDSLDFANDVDLVSGLGIPSITTLEVNIRD